MGTAIGPYSTATEMLAALADKSISSAELVEMHVQRIEERDGILNAIPVHTSTGLERRRSGLTGLAPPASSLRCWVCR